MITSHRRRYDVNLAPNANWDISCARNFFYKVHMTNRTSNSYKPKATRNGALCMCEGTILESALFAFAIYEPPEEF